VNVFNLENSVVYIALQWEILFINFLDCIM